MFNNLIGTDSVKLQVLDQYSIIALIISHFRLGCSQIKPEVLTNLGRVLAKT